jgi:hypothetical protein
MKRKSETKKNLVSEKKFVTKENRCKVEKIYNQRESMEGRRKLRLKRIDLR